MLKDYQKQVSLLDKELGWEDDEAREIILHLVEELGECAREILRKEEYKPQRYNSERMGEELMDLFYLLLKLGNELDINLDEHWDKLEDRYKEKTNIN